MLWNFISEGGGIAPWRWRCVQSSTGSLIRCSSGGFSTLWECAEDATRHGYVREPVQMATSFAAGLSRSFRTSAQNLVRETQGDVQP